MQIKTRSYDYVTTVIENACSTAGNTIIEVIYIYIELITSKVQ